MDELIIYGAGSVGRLILQMVQDINRISNTWKVIGFIDDDQELHGEKITGVPVLGGGEALLELETSDKRQNVQIIIGFSDVNLKKRAVAKITGINPEYATIIHPTAWIADRVSIGEGTVIYPGACIDIDITIGHHVTLNKNATLGHDSTIGDFVTISPGVNLGGFLTVGEGCEFGINSSTIQKVKIGSWSKIGAGACVINDIPANCTAVGVPAKPIKFHK